MALDILIVDDEADIRLLIAGILSDEGYQAREAADSDAALAAIESRIPTLLVLDIWLQGSPLDGLEILEIVKRDYPELPVVIISGHGNIETAVRAIKIGAYDFIEKPFQADRLLLVVERAVEAARLKREVAELRLRAGGSPELIGDSQAINQLRAAIERVAPTGSRVLITGAPGVGKEVVARLLHSCSQRSDGPFVVLNSATMSPDRMEAELCGMEAKAQGPDTPRKTGTFEQAHGGTLFIDEVGDMPYGTQSKILRVLIDQSYSRLGGTTTVRVDVRVISATNRDLQHEIREGRFREDLFHRLNVVPIEVPSLDRRREDIPELANMFLEMFAREQGLARRRLSEGAIATLQTRDFPGNVRQLRNMMEQVLILGGDGAEIDAEELPGGSNPEDGEAGLGGILDMVASLPLREARELFEREYLIAQINRFGGNISRTAGFVGMERSALHRKLKLLGIVTASRGGIRIAYADDDIDRIEAVAADNLN